MMNKFFYFNIFIITQNKNIKIIIGQKGILYITSSFGVKSLLK